MEKELTNILNDYARVIEAQEFDYSPKYEVGFVGDDFKTLKYIDAYFWVEGKIVESFSFDSFEEAIEGMKGLIQFKKNVRA